MRRTIVSVVIVLGLLALSGCGGGATKVEGVVTLDDKPVEGANVSFHPEGGKGTPASSMTDSSGRFTVSGPGKAAFTPGTYKVTVTKTDVEIAAKDLKPGTPEYVKYMEKKAKQKEKGGPKSLIPEKYGELKKTPFEVKIPTDGKAVELKLSSK